MRRTAILVINAVTGFLVIIALILSCVMPLSVKGNLTGSAVSYDEGWVYLNNLDADLMELDYSSAETVILHPITNREAGGRSLCFVTRNVLFSVYVDDEKIYDFHPELTGLYGKFYGDQIHNVILPPLTNHSRLKIICNAITENRWTGFDGMVLENGGSYLLRHFRSNWGKFVLCIVTFWAGLVLFLFGLIEEGLRKDMLELMSLGVISMLLSVWACLPTNMLQMLTGNFAAARVFEHITLMLLPIPVLIYVASMTQNLRSPMIFIGTGVSLLNLTVQLVAVGMGIADYHDMLFISHFLILAGIVSVGFMVAQAIRKKLMSHKQRIFLISAISILFTAGIIDMVRYYGANYDDPSQMVRIGLFLFIVLLAVYEFREIVEIQVRSSEAEMMHRLAMEDALTGLRNRTAFNKHEEDLKLQQEGLCLFVHMDVNFLKKVNDNYGHAAGDEHIKAAADVILGSFGEYGMCYRVGGDEFFAILEGRNCRRDYEQAVAAFRVKQKQYNERVHPPVPLQLAVGMAEYNFRDHNPEAAEKLADTRMYENKRTLKLASA